MHARIKIEVYNDTEAKKIEETLQKLEYGYFKLPKRAFTIACENLEIANKIKNQIVNISGVVGEYSILT